MNQTTEETQLCKHGHKRHDQQDRHPEPRDITITFNGVDKEFNFRPEELVRALLDRALREFHVTHNPHTYGLFNAAGKELNDNETLEAAGVHCGDTLLLRASEVRAG